MQQNYCFFLLVCSQKKILITTKNIQTISSFPPQLHEYSVIVLCLMPSLFTYSEVDSTEIKSELLLFPFKLTYERPIYLDTGCELRVGNIHWISIYVLNQYMPEVIENHKGPANTIFTFHLIRIPSV